MKHSKTTQAIISRKPYKVMFPLDKEGKRKPMSAYFAENVFSLEKSAHLSESEKETLKKIQAGEVAIDKALGTKFANALLQWALAKDVTHFCHWFQPLTGATAEKHDSFISIDNGKPIEELSAKQLFFGEPDASSFPNGGFRQTFEARGYTSWDLSSPVFIRESGGGKILYIPTAFVSFFGNALDVKTPLLRSLNALNREMTKFLNLVGLKDVKKVHVNVGCEQEYFLVDKAYYYNRPDLVMTGRTLLGALPPRNQQLEDHYFGDIEERVLAFMSDLEIELYKMGIPAKTRHNEVAPGQFEIAPIFSDANTAADQNHVLMTTLQSVARRHDFICLLHEKPFVGVNGSGKHINWSMGTDTGLNLLEPSSKPNENFTFLAVVAMVLEAIFRHGETLRVSIASHSNDHRLGANEAPPSIMSVFLGSTLTRIIEEISTGKESADVILSELNLGASQIISIQQDNTDRNRTSPFAFTGNKFEFRAVGSSASIGVPLCFLNSAVADVVAQTNLMVEKDLSEGKTTQEALFNIIQKWYPHARNVVFNGDGYSQAWRDEAKARGLSNLRTTPDVLLAMQNAGYTEHLSKLGVLSTTEISTYFNVFTERYNKHREIEFETLCNIIDTNIIPSALQYKSFLSDVILKQKELGGSLFLEKALLKNLSENLEDLFSKKEALHSTLETVKKLDEQTFALKISNELLPLSEEIATICNKIECQIPSDTWNLPSYLELLFLR